MSQSSNNELALLTIDYVPGREIEHALGTVLGHGDAFGGTSRNRVTDARNEAIADLRNKASRIGADAVVGLSVSVAGVRGFWGFSFFAQSAVVHATGTAVKLKEQK